MATRYAHPESLVDTQWVSEHGGDANVLLAEVDVDTGAYDSGHIEGAVGWNWQMQLQDTISRQLLTKREVERLLGDAGVTRRTTIVLYGDNNNWFAAWAFWFLRLYGHQRLKLMDGGRAKWVAENRPLTTAVPRRTPRRYRAKAPDTSVRAMRDYVEQAVSSPTRIQLVDVRSPAEFSGELMAPENLPQEGAQRSGHIPGAANIPWLTAVNDDGTFKSADELKQIYGGAGIDGQGEVIAYCRIGERSAHTWFALSQLLGYAKVRNYDGSWTEWGSLVGAPVEKK